MKQSNITQDTARGQLAEQLLRRAERQGVRPLSFDEMLGDAKAGDPEKEDVDDFAALRREWRKDERARSRD
ncbi:MAG TPA: hypothetical protein VGN95_19530 [Pyrinomonadaceae bacterium]|jgi:hypothetical protein|nr:hypothetical protein [Pyrinomonadaceae bacterium]